MSKNSIPHQIAQTLYQSGITHIFGIPGTHNIELYDAFRAQEGLTPVLITDEQSSGFMADGYFRASGKMAALSLVPGAGLTHALSGIAEAYLDQIPLLVLACGIRKDSGKHFQLHDVDQMAIVKPISKAAITLTDWSKVQETLKQAIQYAQQVPAGPVVVEIPAEGLITSQLENHSQEQVKLESKPSLQENEIEQVLQKIKSAKNIGLYLGNLMPLTSTQHSQIIQFAETLKAKVWTTITAKGIFPESHSQFIWNVPGLGSPKEKQSTEATIDLWIALGARFGEVATASYGFTPQTDLIHVDLDPKALNQNLKATIALHADAFDFIQALTKKLNQDTSLTKTSTVDTSTTRSTPPVTLTEQDKVTPHELFRSLQEILPPEAIYVVDSGNGMFQGIENLVLNHPRKFLAPVDYSCMGYSIPAAVGAQIAQPQMPVVALPGDGAFLMTGLELLSSKALGKTPMVFLLNDGKLSQIEQFQKGSVVHTTLTQLPKYSLKGIADAIGVEYLKISSKQNFKADLQKAYEYWKQGKALLVDVPIDYSKSTAFTKGVIQANFKRFPTQEKFYLAGRLITRKMGLDLL